VRLYIDAHGGEAVKAAHFVEFNGLNRICWAVSYSKLPRPNCLLGQKQFGLLVVDAHPTPRHKRALTSKYFPLKKSTSLWRNNTLVPLSPDLAPKGSRTSDKHHIDSLDTF
jgi:hypothetical protein